MKLKPAILSALARDDLKQIVDDLGIDGVDRRSAEGMRIALRRARRAKPEDLLAYMRKDQLKEVCECVGVSSRGKRDELVERLVNGEETKPARKKGTPMANDDAGKAGEKQKLLPFKEERQNGKKLDVSALENWLWEAATLRQFYLAESTASLGEEDRGNARGVNRHGSA